jgi:hypothetical protein
VNPESIRIQKSGELLYSAAPRLLLKTVLQRPLVQTDGSHAIQVTVVNGVLQCRHNFSFSLLKIWPGEIVLSEKTRKS